MTTNTCGVCGHGRKAMQHKMEYGLWECSHGECPLRRRAWSEQPRPLPPPRSDLVDPLDDLFDTSNPKES